jgi:hypothetical protein
MGTGPSPGVKQPGRGIDRLPPSSAEVKERVELHLYFSFGYSRRVVGWTFTLYQEVMQLHIFIPNFYINENNVPSKHTFFPDVQGGL